ncbi:MAG: hypothetical protein JO104_09990 [Candidatus Eremiobacteraeota bacterium]|nr:hypothetical protein [Candidatus Eremiobacteraeota bacterium]
MPEVTAMSIRSASLYLAIVSSAAAAGYAIARLIVILRRRRQPTPFELKRTA